MSRIYVDRISPYQSGSLTIDGFSPTVDTGSLATTASLNAYTESNDSKVDSLISETGSYATTGSNTFNGNQVITGSLTSTEKIEFTMPALPSEPFINNRIFSISGSQAFYGEPVDQFFSVDTTSLGSTRFNISSYSSGSFAYGGRITSEPSLHEMILMPSGSDYQARFRVSTSNTTGSVAFIHAQFVNIGTLGGVNRTDDINIGNGSVGNINLTSQNLNITAPTTLNGNGVISGSVDIQNTLTASLQEGNVWVGGPGNRTILVETSSFGSNIDTGSFATTGSNTFDGNQVISGSLTTTQEVNTLRLETTRLQSSATSLDIFADGNIAIDCPGNNIEFFGNTSFRNQLQVDGQANFDDAVNINNDDLTVNGVKVGRGAGNLDSNTVVGNGALNSNTTGFQNTAIGNFAMQQTAAGFMNTAIGANAMQNNTSGSFNVAIGRFSMNNNTTGGENAAVGFDSLQQNIIGNQNTAMGVGASRDSVSGSNNTAIGYQALASNLAGNDNVSIGHFAGLEIDGGGNNTITNNSIYIGAGTKPNANDETNQIVIGGGVSGNGSNTVTIGNGFITNNYFNGDIESDTITVNETLKLTAQDPLPAGELGRLAVSGSDLYFHNGTDWIQK